VDKITYRPQPAVKESDDAGTFHFWKSVEEGQLLKNFVCALVYRYEILQTLLVNNDSPDFSVGECIVAPQVTSGTPEIFSLRTP
jgi:hypothetical protein